MIKKLLPILLFLIPFISHSQTFEWLKTPVTFGTGIPISNGYSNVVDPSGNVYLAGFNDTPVLYTEVFGNLFYRKYNSTGDLLFTKTFTGAAVIHELTSDTSGNILVAIEHLNTLVVDGVSIPNTTQLPQHVLLKLSPAGALLWHKVLSIPVVNVNTFKSIVVDATDTIYIGYDNYGDCFIEKISPLGVTLTVITQANVNRITSIAVDATGNIYATGSCANTNSSYAGTLQPTDLDYSVYLVKYSATGVFQWIKYVEDITCTSPMVQVHDSNAIYWAAETFIPVQLGSIAMSGPTSGGVDFFLAKLDAAGNYLWAKEVPGNGSVEVGSKHFLSLDLDGNVYLSGQISGGQTTWSPSITTNTTTFNNRDALLLKYDASGQIQIAVSGGGFDQDIASSVTIANNGAIYISGLIRGDATFGTIPYTAINLFHHTPYLAKIQNTTLSVPQNERQSLLVYPNPASDFLHLEVDAQIIGANYQIIDDLGRIVATGVLVDTTTEIAVSSLKTGLYFLKIGEQKPVKFMKN